MRTVVISGASSGIGRAIAERMAGAGWRVFAGVRSDDDGNELEQIHDNILAIRLDVTDRAKLEEGAARIAQEIGDQKLGGIVNNAGVAKPGPLSLQPMQDIEKHFSINVLGALNMVQVFAPLLGQDENRVGEPGRIVNITSLGGEIPAPYLGAYTATKHAMESLTDSLRMELNLFGIDAIAIGPGAVKTPIWSKARSDNSTPFENTAFGPSIKRFLDAMVEAGEEGLEPDQVAEVVENALVETNPKARYALAPNKLRDYYLLKALPKRLMDKVFIERFDIRQSDNKG